MIRGAAEDGVKIVCLPELFTIGFDFQYIKKCARAIPNKITDELSKKKLRIFIISGSSQIIDDCKLYNTFLFDLNVRIDGNIIKFTFFI